MNLFKMFFQKIGLQYWLFLQWLGLRCNKCRGRESTSSLSKKLEGAENMGDLLLVDPFFVVTRNRVCDSCGHQMSSRVVGIKEV